MRTRAYRPESPARLEDRSLQSGVAVRSADPVVLPLRKLHYIVDHMQSGFFLYTRYHDASQIYSEIDDVVVNIPFERLDSLDVSIDRIVDGMRQEISAHVPGAIRTARNAVTAVTIADVQARVRAGDVVLR
jgi:hypothetical protein